MQRRIERHAEDIGGADPDPLCRQCGLSLPQGRQKFCSDACLAQFKREQSRLRYGHRHKFICVDCGLHLHPGRRRK